MTNYIELNQKIEKLNINKINLEDELVNILVPIYQILENNTKGLSSIIPKNIRAISIEKIIERIQILVEDIYHSIFIDQNKKKEMINLINNSIPKLSSLSKKKEELDKKIIELEIVINQRKKLVSEKYNELKSIDIKLKQEQNYKSDTIPKAKNISASSEVKKLLNQKQTILSNKQLCEDIKVLHSYDISNDKKPKITNSIDSDIPKIPEPDLNDIDDIYIYVDKLITEQINKVMKYKSLSPDRIKEITIKLRLSVRKTIEEFIMTNKKTYFELEIFSKNLKEILQKELENHLEIKDKLGIEYVTINSKSENKIITITDVIEGKYQYTENNTINRYATIVELSQVDEENLPTIRNFIANIGPELVPIFDDLWIQGDKKRKNKILELCK